MFTETPLLDGWTLEADTLPERLLPESKAQGFTLPGAKALLGFADLLGGEAADDPPTEEEERAKGAPFSLPGMLPGDVSGSASLSREIDFARLSGDRAFLTIDQLCGSGRVMLGHHVLCCFANGISPSESAEIDLTDALRLGRRQTLSIRFDDAAGAGVCGAVLLRTVQAAHLTHVRLSSDSARAALNVRVRFSARIAGQYAVRAALVPDDTCAPWRESRVRVAAPGEGTLSLSFSMPCLPFEAGRAQALPALKLSLHLLQEGSKHAALLCDARTLMTGHPGPAPRAYVPLTAGECRLPPDEIIRRAKALHASALFLPVPAPAPLFRRCAQEGVALVPYAPKSAVLDAYIADNPCVTPLSDAPAAALRPDSPAETLRRLCAMPAAQAQPWQDADECELIADAIGRRIDPGAPGFEQTLLHLRALLARLCAEAARQGQYDGPLCAPGQWLQTPTARALESALSPLHLSALPLRGAWWADTRFSASLQAFIPQGERTGLYSAEAELTDGKGTVYAAFAKDCPVAGGLLGVIEGRLPAHACRLTLILRLLRSGALIERQEIPVYVGERGPLEAAFLPEG